MAASGSLKLDWHAEDVKAAIRKTGTTLTALALASGYHRTAFSIVLSKPYPAIERIIANRLGMQPEDIWPSRYERRRRVHLPRTIRPDASPVTVKTTCER